jgi:hypothetical protein
MGPESAGSRLRTQSITTSTFFCRPNNWVFHSDTRPKDWETLKPASLDLGHDGVRDIDKRKQGNSANAENAAAVSITRRFIGPYGKVSPVPRQRK